MKNFKNKKTKNLSKDNKQTGEKINQKMKEEETNAAAVRKRVHRKINSQLMRKITDGVFGSLVDLTLFSLYLSLGLVNNRPNSHGIYRAFEESDEMLAQFNYQNVKRSLAKLREEGLVEKFKDWVEEPIFTQAGLRRLKSVLPVYQTKRPWNGKIYLINYDVSTKQNSLRNHLRNFLEKLGGVKIQDSLYLIANNPYKFVQDFIKENKQSFSSNNPDGLILISELGKQGFVGEDSLKDFIWKAAGLEKINNDYYIFIERWKDIKSGFSKTAAAIDYYSILQKDPQLPFEILSDDYLGDEAYLLFRKLIKIP